VKDCSTDERDLISRDNERIFLLTLHPDRLRDQLRRLCNGHYKSAGTWRWLFTFISSKVLLRLWSLISLSPVPF